MQGQRRGGMALVVGAAVILFAGVGAMAEGDAAPARDVFSDTWAATDALGRHVAMADTARPYSPGRYVCMFYFLWLGPHANGGPWDVTRILRMDPGAMNKPDSPLWGPLHAPHHWGEALFGYYLTDDPWVLRKHAQMLADAGVDAIVFDTSNRVTYKQQYTALLEAFHAVQQAGNRVPQIAFLTPFGDPKTTVREIYDDLYSKGIHKDLWFQWEGKPLILANKEQVEPELHDFFTFRWPQPDYFMGPIAPDMWSWLEVYPQHVFRNSKGEKEQMSVGVAQNAVTDERGLRLGTMSEPTSRGRSFHDGRDDTRPDAVLHGYNFAEQWERALREDPRTVFVTGWNEWIAGRFQEFNDKKLPVMFVDTFDQENSRDIEPMKGGHGDNYYYQLVDYVRKYKGVRPLPVASAPKTIDLDAGFGAWEDVAPEYRDGIGDVFPRDHPGYNTATRYVNNTGRNDIVLAKVARDAVNLYFYAKTRDPLSPSTDPDWMVLFIDSDNNPATGWQGFDFAVNRQIKDAKTSVIERTRNGWNWQPAGEAQLRVAGNEVMLIASRASLGLPEGEAPLRLSFKWADNFQMPDDTDAFLLNGDAAPNARFRYVYRTE